MGGNHEMILRRKRHRLDLLNPPQKQMLWEN